MIQYPIPFLFENGIEEIMFRQLGQGIELLKCPCCLHANCNTGIRLNLSGNIGACGFLLLRNCPSFDKLVIEDIYIIQNLIVHGHDIQPSPMIISVRLFDEPSSRIDAWDAGYLVTDRRIKGVGSPLVLHIHHPIDRLV